MQTDRDTPTAACTELVVELDEKVHHIIMSNVQIAHALQQELMNSVQDLLAILGIPGQPKIHFETLPNTAINRNRFLRLFIDGQRCRYPDELCQRIYSYVNGLHSGLLASKKHMMSWLRREDNEQDPASDVDVVAFINILCLEIIKLQPSVLLGPAQVEAYRFSLLSQFGISNKSDDNSVLNSQLLRRLLSIVLDFRISISDVERVYPILREGFDKNDSAEDIAEHLIVELRSDKIQVQLPPEYLKQLTLSHSAEGQTLFALMRDGLFYDHGLRFPDFSFALNESLKPNCFAFQINDLTTAPQLGLPPEKVLVNDTAERLRVLNISGIPALNPVQANEFSLIDVQDQDVAENAGLTSWDQLGYLILCLSMELRRHGVCFVHLEQVEKNLNQLEESFPALVAAATEKYSIAQITQVLRALVAEELSIRNLRLILERHLHYDYIIVDSSKYIVFDDRLPLAEQPRKTWADKTQNCTAFVRIGMKAYTSHKYTRGQNSLVVYLLDPEIEQMIVQHQKNDDCLPEEKCDLLLNAIGEEVSTPPYSYNQPVLLTTSEVRNALRKVIDKEYPRLPVLSYPDLSPELNVRPIARISLVTP
ncbi:FHIPEP family type III secretion protein [candidate division KSB1 bacterium]|nr:FHIPEP family type III secretion protein [candidate division KSB1 bacterium]